MEEPLRRLLEFGVDASAFQACASCHIKPVSITVRGKRRESCCNRDKKSRRSTPKYAMHPVPEVLNRTFNASSQCLKFFDTYGLIRVNPRESCFMVQARLPDPRSRLRRARGSFQKEVKPWESLHDERGLKWRQVGDHAILPYSPRGSSKAKTEPRSNTAPGGLAWLALKLKSWRECQP